MQRIQKMLLALAVVVLVLAGRMRWQHPQDVL